MTLTILPPSPCDDVLHIVNDLLPSQVWHILLMAPNPGLMQNAKQIPRTLFISLEIFL